MGAKLHLTIEKIGYRVRPHISYYDVRTARWTTINNLPIMEFGDSLELTWLGEEQRHYEPIEPKGSWN